MHVNESKSLLTASRDWCVDGCMRSKQEGKRLSGGGSTGLVPSYDSRCPFRGKFFETRAGRCYSWVLAKFGSNLPVMVSFSCVESVM